MSTIASDIPGRLRVRFSRAEQLAVLGRVSDRLGAIQGVRADARPDTGSIVLRYDPAKASRETLIAAFRAEGLDVSDDRRRPRDHRRSPAQMSTRLTDAMSEANAAISRGTGERADLRLLIPAALAVLGSIKLVRDGPGLEQIPAWVMLWYAFDAFYKLNRDTALGRALEREVSELEELA